MTSNLYEPLARLVDAYRRGSKLVLLFDYDGTLTPLVDQPWQAQLALPTRTLLQRLAGQPGVSVGVFSGRMLDDLQQMVGIPRLFYSGVSGLELELDGVRRIDPGIQETRHLVEQIARPLSELSRCFEGAWVEYKHIGLTLHYRNVAAAQLEELRARVSPLLVPYADAFSTLEGPGALEINLTGWTRGDAVRQVLAYVGQPALVLYAGDGANDGESLKVVADLGGLTVGVGPLAPANAEFYCLDPGCLVRWLEGLLLALQELRRDLTCLGQPCPPSPKTGAESPESAPTPLIVSSSP